MACLGEIDRAEQLGERQESFKEGKGDVDVESDEESWHSFDEDCDADGSKLPVWYACFWKPQWGDLET